MKSLIFIRTSSVIAGLGLKCLLEQFPGTDVSVIHDSNELQPYRRLTNCNILYIADQHYLFDIDNTPNFHASAYFDQIIFSDSPVRELPVNIAGSIHLRASKDEIAQLMDSFINRPTKTTNPNSENELTQRELELLKLLAMGHSNKEIASKLFISTHTVITHRKNISEKLGIRSASGLTVYAIINHLIDTDSIDPNGLI